MGLILDTSILIASERRGGSIEDILQQARAAHGETDIALSTVTVIELTHGIYRARTDTDREGRRACAEEALRVPIVHPVTLEVAQLAGQIEAEQAAKGISVAIEDL